MRDAFNNKITEIAGENFFGFDINPDLVKATKMNMVMNNDGSGNIIQLNSLLPPHEWSEEKKQLLEERMGRPKNSIVNHKTIDLFDVIVTNPPFGSKIPINDQQILGIHGPSGCGKSTLLKLLMRFWDVQKGNISISGKNIRTINTAALRSIQSYVTQETVLFRDTIANNIAIGKPGATREQIIEAAKKASLHDFIITLPKQYDTPVGESGSTLSGGERQRIGLARAFLHDAPLMLLDEPTSNLDVLNEGIILKSLKEKSKNKTVVIVSHRMSTLNIAHTVFNMVKE